MAHDPDTRDIYAGLDRFGRVKVLRWRNTSSSNDRRRFEGILWVLRSGARWKDLPRELQSPATCWRRMNEWAESDVLEAIWTRFLDELNDEHLLDWDEVFVDGTFSPAKEGALRGQDQAWEGNQVAASG